jgi:hypothetical protein
MNMQIIVDQKAKGSLMLIERLQQVGKVQHQGDGIFTVEETTENAVFDVTEEFPEAVMKVETV